MRIAHGSVIYCIPQGKIHNEFFFPLNLKSTQLQKCVYKITQDFNSCIQIFQSRNNFHALTPSSSLKKQKPKTQ